jgi:hypothetical protein
MNDLTNEITKRHQSNSEAIQSIMKTFYQGLKEKLYSKRDENYHLVKEIQQLEREKIQLQQQTLFCMRRIADLEETVGVIKNKEIMDN